jgi:preprotein translocase subunit SecF
MARTRTQRPSRTTVPMEGAGLRVHLHVNFVRRWKVWFAASGILLVIFLGAIGVRGLNLSLEFIGGSSFVLSGVEVEVTDQELEDAALDAGAQEVRAQIVTEGGSVIGAIVNTEAIEPGSTLEGRVQSSLSELARPADIEINFVGPTWGDHVSRKMLEALIVFLVIIVAYISIRLEFKMAIAALVALTHDILVAAGVYALFGFTVSPATVIAFLTILGYSLYDTVIVFDRVQETTVSLGGPGRRSYGQAVNTAMNDVLWRTVNTTISSTLPVAALLVIGSRLLGATTLFDLALALFVGMLAGSYSSLFIAGPFLALWKERDPRLAELAKHAEIRERRGEDGYDDEDTSTSSRTDAEMGSETRSESPTASTATAVDDPKAEKDEPRRAADDKPAQRPRRPQSGPVKGPGKKSRRKRR